MNRLRGWIAWPVSRIDQPPSRALRLHLLARKSLCHEMTDLRRPVSDVERADAVPDFLVGHGHPLVLTEVLDPGFHEERFGPAVGDVRVREQPPLERAVAQADAPEILHRRQELRGMLGTDLVLDR